MNDTSSSNGQKKATKPSIFVNSRITCEERELENVIATWIKGRVKAKGFMAKSFEKVLEKLGINLPVRLELECEELEENYVDFICYEDCGKSHDLRLLLKKGFYKRPYIVKYDDIVSTEYLLVTRLGEVDIVKYFECYNNIEYFYPVPSSDRSFVRIKFNDGTKTINISWRSRTLERSELLENYLKTEVDVERDGIFKLYEKVVEIFNITTQVNIEYQTAFFYKSAKIQDKCVENVAMAKETDNQKILIKFIGNEYWEYSVNGDEIHYGKNGFSIKMENPRSKNAVPFFQDVLGKIEQLKRDMSNGNI